MDLAEAARELGVHYQTAYRWVREGALRAVKVGKSYRVERRDLDRFAQRRERGTDESKRSDIRHVHSLRWGEASVRPGGRSAGVATLSRRALAANGSGRRRYAMT